MEEEEAVMELIASIQKVITDFGNNIQESAIRATSTPKALDAIVDLNVNDQLYNRGVNPDNEKITPSYTRYTVSKKRSKGDPYDRVTTRDTGLSHERTKATASKTEINIDTDTPYWPDLEKKYGQLFGLTTSNLNTIVQGFTLPNLKLEIEAKLSKI